MADAYWSYADPRQLNAAAAAATAAHAVPDAKRPRTDIAADAPGGNDMSQYYTSEDGRIVQRVITDNDPIGASYDNYLRRTQMQQQMQVHAGNEPARPAMNGGMSGHPVSDPRVVAGMVGVSDPRFAGVGVSDPRFAGIGVSDQRFAGIGVSDQRVASIGVSDQQRFGVSDPALASKNRGGMVMGGGGGGRYELALPPDASSTLFVEGLPANCTRREVAHIFRPFVGYKEVRLVTKDSKRSGGGDALVLCFVDFISPAHAATAMDALEGYKFDEVDRDSLRLRLQFARHPGARSGGGRRGKR